MKYRSYQWAPHELDGVVYDLSHLDAFSFDHQIAERLPAPGRTADPVLTVTVNVAFSHHCFSNGKTSAAFNPSAMYAYAGDPRSFCAERYRLSKRLPVYIKELPKSRCFRTVHGNHFVVAERVDKGGFYTAYFRVRRSRSSAPSVDLLVESAYIKRGRPDRGRAAVAESFGSIVLRNL